MTQRSNIISVSLSDEEYNVIQLAAHIQHVKIATHLRVMLLVWAFQVAKQPGRVRGGRCEVCGCEGATWWSFLVRRFFCASCGAKTPGCAPGGPPDPCEDISLVAIAALHEKLNNRVVKGRPPLGLLEELHRLLAKYTEPVVESYVHPDTD